MPIRIACGKCKKALTAPDNMAGKKVKCPGCQSVLDVPAGIPAHLGETRLAAKPPGAPAGATPVPRPAGAPLATKPQAAPPAPAAPAAPAKGGKTNRCPKCQKELDAEAVICIDCGINIRTGAKFNTSIG